MKKVIILGLSVALLGGLAGCNSDSEESISSSSTPQQTSQTSKSQSSSQQNTDFKVSIEDAIKEYQKEYPDSDITSIDLETSLGTIFTKSKGSTTIKNMKSEWTPIRRRSLKNVKKN